MKENETRNISNFNPADGFICKKCGIRLEDWCQLEEDPDDGEISCHEYEFKFCPNCGRKIIEEGSDD
jgi:predicted RNA-binding Zn-ribbon protein involved in translation (DUF1610 family)